MGRFFEEKTSLAVVEEVAKAKDTPPLDLPPLYESIDTDALNMLMRNSSDCQVTFKYTGYVVSVTEENEVTLQE